MTIEDMVNELQEYVQTLLNPNFHQSKHTCAYTTTNASRVVVLESSFWV